MRFKVTGGKDGLSGIEVADRRYEPGEIVELTQAKAEWLLSEGYLEPADGKGSKPAPAPIEEPVVESEPTDVVTDEVTE